MSCTQPLLIHVDGTGSCAVPGCLDPDTLTDAVLRHRYVVNCRAVLGPRCEVCHPARSDDGESRPPSDPAGRDTNPLCPGVAIVHADLSLECSVPGCGTEPLRGTWLAKHADVRSCSDLSATCPLCSLSDDHG
jgi:hypothetical protein